MKKILRVIFRFLLLILIGIGDIFVISKIFTSNISDIAKIIIFFLLICISIILGIELVSNPQIKIHFFKNRKRRIKKSNKTVDFLEICQHLMQEYGQELEKYRHDVLNNIKILVLIFVLEFIITIILFKLIELNAKALIVIYILPTMFIVYKFMKSKDIFYEKYKKNIIGTLVPLINKNLLYDYDGSEEMCDIYMGLNFKTEEFNTFENTDHIYGTINNLGIQLSKMKLLNCNESGETINVVDTFLFGYNKINFISPCEIRIKKNQVIYKDKNRVELDSEEFEKDFDVISDSHIIAMQILTHDVMQEIVDFYQKYKMNFEILIREDKIYIKFETGDVFKPNIFKKVIDNELLWIYYNILDFVTKLSYRINKVLEGIEI